MRWGREAQGGKGGVHFLVVRTMSQFSCSVVISTRDMHISAKAILVYMRPKLEYRIRMSWACVRRS